MLEEADTAKGQENYADCSHRTQVGWVAVMIEALRIRK
jgi:hypothetical protein